MMQLARLGDLKEGTPHRFDVEGTPIVVVRLGDEVFAVCAICPHRGGPLEDGDLNDGILTCPWHGWDFDVRTGESPTFGERIECYPIQVRDGIVYLTEPPAKSG